MFKKKVLEQDRILREKWQEGFLKRYGGREFETTTSSGIRVKPAYSAADIEKIDYADIGLPGEYPYTRGVYPVLHQYQAWMNEQVHGYGLPEQTRERMDLLSKHGMEGYFGGKVYNVVADLASDIGYDPDDPRAEGWVSKDGVAIYTVEDMERLIHDLPLDKTNFVWNIRCTSMAMLAIYIVAAEKMGFSREKLRGNTMNALYARWYWDTIGFPPESSFKLMGQLIKFCTREMPLWNTTNISGYGIEEAGANPVQETAFTMATSIALTEHCMRAGLKPDDFLPRFSFQMAQGSDFLENIAKLRALRRIWAKVNRDRFGCSNPKAMQARIYVQTSGASLTAQQPLNNIVRVALQTLGAALAGVNAMHTASYDEALAIPTEEAAILALRTQQITLYETKVPNVTDPLGGSYYLEWLTSKIESEAHKLIQKIDDMGGYLECWKSGWFRGQLTQSAYEWREKLNRGEEIVVGVNKYVTEEQQKVPIFSVDPSLGKVAAERIIKYRSNRNSTETKDALENLRREAMKVHESDNGKVYLMPALIEAFGARATLGETWEVLRQVFGYVDD